MTAHHAIEQKSASGGKTLTPPSIPFLSANGFTYTSTVLGKNVTSPFAVLARGQGGKLSYVQFMEDTFAIVRSFLESGTYRIRSNPDGSSVDV